MQKKGLDKSLNKGLNEGLNKSNNKGCLAGILGTVAVLLGVVAFALLSTLVNNLLLSARFGDSDECALLPLSLWGVGAAFVLFEVIFVFWQIKGAKRNTPEGKKLGKIFKIVTAVCIALVLLIPILSANIYTRLDSQSISKVFFAEYKAYSIKNDVERCTLTCSEDGKLAYIVTMKDGEKIELLDNVNSCGNGFIEKYDNLYGYAAYVNECFTDSGNAVTVRGKEHIERIYKESNSEIWQYLEKIISEKE